MDSRFVARNLKYQTMSAGSGQRLNRGLKNLGRKSRRELWGQGGYLQILIQETRSQDAESQASCSLLYPQPKRKERLTPQNRNKG
jgi:hypothetical protein